MTQQLDLFVEADERKKPVSVRAAELIRVLPKGLNLSVVDIANAWGISCETVRGYIDDGNLSRHGGRGNKRKSGKILYLEACDLANRIFPKD